MDNNKCLALIPYVPTVKRRSRILSAFSERRFIYFWLFPVSLALSFAGAYYFYFCFSVGVIIPFASFVLGLYAIGLGFFIQLFLVLVSAFTVFSPAGAVLLLSSMSFGIGAVVMNAFVSFGFTMTFFAVAFEQSAFSLVAFLYVGEIAARVSVTRMGVKYYCAARYSFPLFLKTFVFIAAFVCNSFYLDKFSFLKG